MFSINSNGKRFFFFPTECLLLQCGYIFLSPPAPAPSPSGKLVSCVENDFSWRQVRWIMAEVRMIILPASTNRYGVCATTIDQRDQKRSNRCNCKLAWRGPGVFVGWTGTRLDWWRAILIVPCTVRGEDSGTIFCSPLVGIFFSVHAFFIYFYFLFSTGKRDNRV